MVHALLLVPLALGAARVVTTGAVHAELSGRSQFTTYFGVLPELRVQPMLAADVASGTLHLGVGYSPVVTASVTGANALHIGALGAEWKFTRRHRLNLTARGSIGRYDTQLALAVAQPSAPTQIVPATTIDYLETSAVLGLDLGLVPRLRLLGDVGYRVNGGLTDAARNVIPLTHGPVLNLGLTYEPSGRESLSVKAELSRQAFSVGRTADIAKGAATWSRKLVRDVDLYASAGAAGVRSTDQVPTVTEGVVPVAGVGARVGRPELVFGLDLLLSPFPDALTGVVYEQGGGTLSAEWRPKSDILVRSRAGASWSVVGDNAGDRTILVETSAALLEEKRELSFGLRVADVRIQSSITPHIFEVQALVGITLAGFRVH